VFVVAGDNIYKILSKDSLGLMVDENLSCYFIYFIMDIIII
jgi:hypothetical protein